MNAWNRQIFSAGAVNKGNVVRRKRADVFKFGDIDELVLEVQRRRFHMLETGDQLIIICNPGVVRVVC
jgi:hypothetical protein